MTTSPGRFYDEPFLNPQLSTSLAGGISESSRKEQLFNHAHLHLKAQRQICRREDLLAYARENYTLEALAAGLK